MTTKRQLLFSPNSVTAKGQLFFSPNSMTAKRQLHFTNTTDSNIGTEIKYHKSCYVLYVRAGALAKLEEQNCEDKDIARKVITERSAILENMLTIQSSRRERP